MSSALGDSLRPLKTRTAFAVITSLIVSHAGASLFGQCPPASLQNDFVDTQVAGTNSTRPTIGMSSTSAIIVAYEGDYNNNREILARRFDTAGSPTEASFPLTEQHTDPNLTCEGVEAKKDPTLAVSSTGQVAVAFSGAFKDCRLRDISCTQDSDCNYINLCDPFECALYARDCTGGWCYYPVNEQLIHRISFGFSATPDPYQMPFTFFERSQFEPSIGVNSAGSPMLAWANPFSACNRDAPFGWTYGPDSDSGTAFLACATPCGGTATAQCSYFNENGANDPQPCIARRSDGYYLIAWADPETPGLVQSYFNVYVQVYSPAAIAIGGSFWSTTSGPASSRYTPATRYLPRSRWTTMTPMIPIGGATSSSPGSAPIRLAFHPTQPSSPGV